LPRPITTHKNTRRYNQPRTDHLHLAFGESATFIPTCDGKAYSDGEWNTFPLLVSYTQIHFTAPISTSFPEL
jgi:hypothetical protein